MTITATPVPAMLPVPHLRFNVSGRPAGAVAFTLRRRQERRLVDVRGAVRVSATATLVVRDWQAPYDGRRLEYVGEWLSASGAVLGQESTETSMRFAGTVIQQPLDPTKAVRVRDLEASAIVTSRKHRGQHASVGGSILPAFIGAGTSGVVASLEFAITSREDRATLEAALDVYPVLCMRTSLPMDLPSPFIFHVPDLVLDSYDRPYGGGHSIARWDVEESREPIPALVMTAYTYEDIEASFATYAAIEAAFATYEDLEDATYLAGAA